MKGKRTTLAVAVAGLLLLQAAEASAHGDLPPGAHWPGGWPHQITVLDGFERPRFSRVLRRTLASYEAGVPISFAVRSVPVEQCSNREAWPWVESPASRGKVLVCDLEGPVTTLGFAAIDVGPDGHIRRAIVGIGQLLVRATMCEEIGHVLGLDHSGELKDCVGGIASTPSAAELDALRHLYAHRD